MSKKKKKEEQKSADILDFNEWKVKIVCKRCSKKHQLPESDFKEIVESMVLSLPYITPTELEQSIDFLIYGKSVRNNL